MIGKDKIRILYQPGRQVVALINFSRFVRRIPLVGRIISILTDNLILFLYGLEVTSPSIDVNELVIGHSTGVVLGGNGIKCTGRLHISSGVVFARRYGVGDMSAAEDFFSINGDVTIGANSVLLGSLVINGPVIIGAMSLVSSDILEPGVYVGCPAKKIRDL